MSVLPAHVADISVTLRQHSSYFLGLCGAFKVHHNRTGEDAWISTALEEETKIYEWTATDDGDDTLLSDLHGMLLTLSDAADQNPAICPPPKPGSDFSKNGVKRRHSTAVSANKSSRFESLIRTDKLTFPPQTLSIH